MLEKLISDLAIKKYGVTLGMLKLKWSMIDSDETFPISYNSGRKSLVIKCKNSSVKLEKRYQVDVIKHKIHMNFGMEIDTIKFVD